MVDFRFILSCLLVSVTEKIPVSVSAEQPTTKKLAVSSDRIYVLQVETRRVIIFDANQKEKKRFEIATPYSRALPRPVDISFDQDLGILYVLDAEFNEIWCYDQNGEFTHRLPMVLKYLQSPSAILALQSKLLIADIGCLWVADELGHVIDRVKLPTGPNGIPAVITDLTWEDYRLYGIDSTSCSVLRFGGNKYWDFSSPSRIGGFGTETGRWLQPTGIAVEGNLYVADQQKGTVTRYHSFLRNATILPVTGQALVQPTDLSFFNQRLWMVERNSERLIPIDTGLNQQTKKVVLSQNSIDFGSWKENAGTGDVFTLFSVDGSPISGTVTSSNPLFTLDRAEFTNEIRQSFVVSPSLSKMKDKTTEAGTITVKLDNGETKSFEVRAKKRSDPDFQVVVSDWTLDIVENDFSFEIECRKQNEIQGTLEFSFGASSIPFTYEWQEQKMPIESYFIKNQVMLKPVKNPPSGLYSLPLVVKCPEAKLVKQITVTFVYTGWDKAVPGTILGEYFAADWCEFCPAGHMALPELHQKYTKDEVVFMTYYNDCMEATPERLCFSEGETRMKWYNPVGIHVALILNGTTIKEGGYNDGVTTMTKEYDELIKGLSPMKSPVSLSGSANWDFASRTLQVGATLQCLQEMNWNNPRLYCVLAEHGIAFNAKNGVKEHNYVIRDFLALPNPEKNDAFGSPVWGLDGSVLSQANDQWQGHLETAVDPLVKMENAFILLFVQDNETKQVYQARYIPLQQEVIHDMTWVPENKSVRLNQDQRGTARMWLVNRGNRIDQFDVLVNNRKPFMGEDTWKVGGNEYSIQQTVSVTLNPMESVMVEFSLNPIWGKPEMPYLDVKSVNSVGDEAYCLIPVKGTEHQPRFEVVYPDSSILDKDKGFSLDRKNFCCVIRTEPGTQPNDDRLREAGPDGIIVFMLGGCFKKDNYSETLYYPDTIQEEINLYFETTLTMRLQIGSRIVWVNREKIEYEAALFIQNSRTMVPIRIIAENLLCGAQVEWDPVKQTVSIKTEDLRIILQVGKSVANVNGKQILLDAPPTIRNGRTFLPLRFISENLGAEVEWNGKTQTITIRK